MRVILFRHGPAGHADPARWPDDAARPVTKRGIERTARAAAGLKRVVGRVGRVATSPLVRARQTADILGEALTSGIHVETVDALAPGAALRDTMRWLRGLESGASVVLVGHEPHLGKLAGMMLFDAPTSPIPMKKAGAFVIDFVGPVSAGSGRLRAFLPPRVLRLLAPRTMRQP